MEAGDGGEVVVEACAALAEAQVPQLVAVAARAAQLPRARPRAIAGRVVEAFQVPWAGVKWNRRWWVSECSREGFGLEGVAGAPGVGEFVDSRCRAALVVERDSVRESGI